MSTTFGTYLRARRKKAGLSLRAVAKIIGVSAAYLSKVERNRADALSPDRCIQIASVLGVDSLNLLVEEALARGRVELPDGTDSLRRELARRWLGDVIAHAARNRRYP